jgi:hypothetical protein
MLLTCTSVLAADIWLAGSDPVLRRTSYKDERPTDYMQLFEDNAPWGNAARKVKAFKVYTQFVASATDEQLAKLFADLKKRRIDLAEETMMLPLGPNGCGRGVEGYLDPNGLQTVMERIKRLGGELRYVAMDEPLWFGHVSNQANSCHSPIDAIARDVASRVAVIKKVFPNIEVGDTEPLASPAQPADWLNEISAWIAAYKQAVGAPLSFYDADLTWSANWQPQLVSLAGRLRAAGVAYGVIYDGDSTDSSGTAWVQHAENRFVQVEGNPATVPDRALLQSWTLQPEHMLPETDPGTMTYLVNSYSRHPVTLTLRRENNRLTGTLGGASGAPLAGGKVQVFLVGGNSPHVKSDRTLSEVVPAGAQSAIVALRINSECGCSGAAHVDIGQVSYSDSKSSAVVRQPMLPNPSDNDFVAAPGQAVSRNSAPIPVTPGSPFTFKVSMGATSDSANSGYVALAFMDGAGHELERLRVPFSPATTELGTAVTNASGSFTLPLPTATPSGAGFSALFSGDARTRPATASLQ